MWVSSLNPPVQFRKPGAPPREEILEEVYEDELDLQRSGSYLDSSIASAWSERSLDPGDIRVSAAHPGLVRCYCKRLGSPFSKTHHASPNWGNSTSSRSRSQNPRPCCK